MYGIAAFFFFVVFKALIPAELAKEYLAGAVILGAAPCTAMVFLWSHLTKGDPAYTLVQVAVNDLIILVAFTPIVAFLLGVSNVVVLYDTLNKPYFKMYGDKMLVNAGSAGKPKTGTPKANYVVIDLYDKTPRVEIYEVDYEFEKTAKAIEEAGLLQEFADIIRTGKA